MAEYKKLLYSVGGGIISDAQLDAQNGSATIAIGLGGTGKDAIKRLKKEVYQRIAPDNAANPIAPILSASPGSGKSSKSFGITASVIL